MNQTKERILKAASELFAKGSYEGVSIREIARKADVNSSLISYYFGGKENLYKAVLSQHFDELLEYVSRMSTSDELAFIKEFMKNHIRVMRKRGKFAAIVAFRELGGEGRFGREFMELFLKRIAERLCGVIESARAKGLIRDLPTEVVMHFLIHVDTLFALRFPEMDEETASDMAFELFIRGAGA
ncbi:MAG: TetR/AcrR family transcriptional regulator [Deferribacteres bacterium]|nr:TetR/AcrR family transcriptional regulator [Deferribacteres bacterium]